MNQIKYEERLVFIKSTVFQELGLHVSFHPSNSSLYGELYMTSNI